MGQFSPIITGSLPRHANEVVWRRIHTEQTLRYEGGFSGKNQDGHVTLFGVTAATAIDVMARRQNLDPTARTILLDMMEKNFTSIGKKVKPNGRDVPDITPDERRALDAAREASYELWRDEFLLKPGFDKLKTPILQGIAADTAFHAGVGGAFNILARVAGVEFSKEKPNNRAWTADVIARINALAEQRGDAYVVALIGKAKQELHLDNLATAETRHGSAHASVIQIRNAQEGFTNRIYEGFPAMYAALNPDASRLEIPQPDRQRGGLPALTALRLERIGAHLDAGRIARITVADPDPDHGVRPVTISVAGLPNVKGILHCLIADHEAAVTSQERGDGGTLKLATEEVGACGLEEIAAKQLADKVFSDAARSPTQPKQKAKATKAPAR